MEKIVKVTEIGQLVERTWTNERGETRTIASVEVVVTDGIDTFVAEANEELARSLDKQVKEKNFDFNALYEVRISSTVRESKEKKIKFNSIRLQQIVKLCG